LKATSASRREAEERLRREHILLAAERVFAARPFEEASMQQIAREAGIGMHGLYRQFPSKQELYEEIVVVRLKEISQQLKGMLENTEPADRLHLLCVTHARFFLEHPHFLPILVTRRLSRDWGLKTRIGKSFDRHIAEVDKQLAEAIEAAVKKGKLRPLGTEFLMTAAIGIFTSVIQHYLLRSRTTDAEACAAEMQDLFFRGAGPDAQGS
jgi:AcrR family transcriptional regulator